MGSPPRGLALPAHLADGVPEAGEEKEKQEQQTTKVKAQSKLQSEELKIHNAVCVKQRFAPDARARWVYACRPPDARARWVDACRPPDARARWVDDEWETQRQRRAVRQHRSRELSPGLLRMGQV